MKILRRAQYRAIPWKNGRGTAHRIAVSPARAGYDTLDWHVSRPEIAAAGPFSRYPGLDRQFMLIGGSGLDQRRPAVEVRSSRVRASTILVKTDAASSFSACRTASA